MKTPNYERSYWKAVELQEKVERDKIKLPYARGATINRVIELLKEIQSCL